MPTSAYTNQSSSFLLLKIAMQHTLICGREHLPAYGIDTCHGKADAAKPLSESHINPSMLSIEVDQHIINRLSHIPKQAHTSLEMENDKGELVDLYVCSATSSLLPIRS